MPRLSSRRCALLIASATLVQLLVANGPIAAQSTVLLAGGVGTLVGGDFENASAGLALKGQWLRGEGWFQRGLAAEYVRVEAPGFEGAIHHFDALIALRARSVEASIQPYMQGTFGLASQHVAGGTGISRGLTFGLALGVQIPTIRPLIDVGVDARALWIDAQKTNGLAEASGHTLGLRLAGLVGLALFR